MPQSFSILLLDSDGKAVRIGIDDLVAASRQSESRWRLEVDGAGFNALLSAVLRYRGTQTRLQPAIPLLTMKMLMNPPQEKVFRIDSDGIGLIVEGSLARELDYPPHLRPRLVLEEDEDTGYDRTTYPGVPISRTSWGMRWLQSLFSDDLNIVQPIAIMAKRDGAVEVMHLHGGDAANSKSTNDDLLSIFLMLTNSIYGRAAHEIAFYAIEDVYTKWLNEQDTEKALWRLAGDYILLSGIWKTGGGTRPERRREIMNSDAAVRFYKARINGRWAGVPLSIVSQKNNPETREITDPARKASTHAIVEFVILTLSGKKLERRKSPWPETESEVKNPAGLIALTHSEMDIIDLDIIDMDVEDRVLLRARAATLPTIHIVSGVISKERLRIYTSFAMWEASEKTGEFLEWFAKNDRIFGSLYNPGC